MSLIMKCNCIGLILNCVFCSLLLTKNMLHLGITFTVADLTETLFDTLKAFCSFLNEKYWSDTANTQGVYSVLWMCSETRWPTCSLSGKSTYWPHGLLPKSNYYTHTRCPWYYNLYIVFALSLSKITSHFTTLHNVILFIQGHLLTLIIISVTL